MNDDTDLRLGARPRAGWLWAGVWLVYLTIPLNYNFRPQYAPWRQAAGMIGFWLFCYAYTRLVIRTRNDTGRSSSYLPWGADRAVTLLLAELIVLAAVLPLASTPTWIALWIYVASACGSVLPYEHRRWGLLGGVLATGALVLEGVLLDVDAGTWSWMVLPSIFSCLAVIGVRRMRNLIAELHQAREEVKYLAVNEERLRLSRDLHDLAGHSMATITLKAELARRLLPSDIAAAEKQVADIEQVSRQALADIREAVSGYRRATLAVETVSARTALEAAQISFEHDASLLSRSWALDSDAEAALAWCLREAVTNVVRHSGASWCRVRLIEARVDGERTVTLEVTDDGSAAPCPPQDVRDAAQSGPGARSAAGSAPGPRSGSGSASRSGSGSGNETACWGNGLTGLHERLAPFSATLSAVPVAPHGFRLTATLPVD
jgi:two-component system sensor histidine kinase DesK